jgi:hypothetical protein
LYNSLWPDLLGPRAFRTASLLVGYRLPDLEHINQRSLQRAVMEEQLPILSATHLFQVHRLRCEICRLQVGRFYRGYALFEKVSTICVNVN